MEVVGQAAGNTRGQLTGVPFGSVSSTPSCCSSTCSIPLQVATGSTTSIRARSLDCTATGTLASWRPAKSSSRYRPESSSGARNSTGSCAAARPRTTGRPAPTRRTRHRYGRPRASTFTRTRWPAVTGRAGISAAIARTTSVGLPRPRPRSAGTSAGVVPTLCARSRALTWTM